MFVSHTLKCRFLHIPRTGGTAVIAALLPFTGDEFEDRWKPKTGTDYYNLMWNSKREGRSFGSKYHHAMHNITVRDRLFKEFQNYFSFTIVRNPWDRALSLWKWQRYSQGRSLEDFLLAIRNGEFRRTYHGDLAWPQMHWIKGDRGFGVDSVLNTELLEDHLNEIKCDLGNDGIEEYIPVPKANLHEDRRTRFDLFDKNTIELVAEIYREDIDRLYYTFGENKE